jgi:hypothetical protein
MKIHLEAELPTDSKNYEIITQAVSMSATVRGLSCEIGLRRGGGTKYIIDALKLYEIDRVHIAIDPYGNIEYADSDTHKTRFDYTNSIRDECLINLYLYCLQKGQNIIFFNLEDTEFFSRYADGVPVYNQTKTIEAKYSFVHFDGPHSVNAISTEIDFFHQRTEVGAVFVFDDITNYHHDQVHDYLKTLNWACVLKSERKWAYQKKY